MKISWSNWNLSERQPASSLELTLLAASHNHQSVQLTWQETTFEYADASKAYKTPRAGPKLRHVARRKALRSGSVATSSLSAAYNVPMRTMCGAATRLCCCSENRGLLHLKSLSVQLRVMWLQPVDTRRFARWCSWCNHLWISMRFRRKETYDDSDSQTVDQLLINS